MKAKPKKQKKRIRAVIGRPSAGQRDRFSTLPCFQFKSAGQSGSAQIQPFSGASPDAYRPSEIHQRKQETEQ